MKKLLTFLFSIITVAGFSQGVTITVGGITSVGNADTASTLQGRDTTYLLNRINHTGLDSTNDIAGFQDSVAANDSVVLNTTHRTSDGSDHTFIDQDVTNSGTPSFQEITITDDATFGNISADTIFADILDSDTLQMNSLGRILLDSSGRIGIGTDTPRYNIEVIKSMIGGGTIDNTANFELTFTSGTQSVESNAIAGELSIIGSTILSGGMADAPAGVTGFVTHASTGTVECAFGVAGGFFTTVATPVGTVAQAVGTAGFVFHTTTGTITKATALAANVQNLAAGTITDAIGINILSIVNSGGGTNTNAYGVKVEDITAGSNNWAIKTGSGTVSFGDSLIVTGDVSATTIGQITEANLLDKSAGETITGLYTFDNLVADSINVDSINITSQMTLNGVSADSMVAFANGTGNGGNSITSFDTLFSRVFQSNATTYSVMNGEVTAGGCVSLADDASITLPDATTQSLVVYVDGDDEWALAAIQTDGTVALPVTVGSVVNTDTDTNLCIFDNGTGATIRNRLGSTKTVCYTTKYKQ